MLGSPGCLEIICAALSLIHTKLHLYLNAQLLMGKTCLSEILSTLDGVVDISMDVLVDFLYLNISISKSTVIYVLHNLIFPHYKMSCHCCKLGSGGLLDLKSLMNKSINKYLLSNYLLL